MKTKIVGLLFCAVLSSTAVAQKTVKESLALASPLVIDGQVDDWHTEWLMDNKSKFLYNVANDQENFYIRLKISDPILQQKILVFGLTIYFNPDGGTKKGKLGIVYPIAKTKDEMKEQQSKEAASDKPWNEVKKDLIRDAELLELIGLDKEHIVSPRVGLMNGLEIVMSLDSFSDLLYETKIPFKSFRIDKSKVQELGLVFETGRLIIPPSTTKATYARGQRYAAPAASQPYNEFTSATKMQAVFKLN